MNNGKWKRQRNLPQYKNMSEDDFEELMLKKEDDVKPSQEFEKRIELKLKKFTEDYDISDMKMNDHETLRALIQALISLEDYEQIVYKFRKEGITDDTIVKLDKVNKVMSDLRRDISSLQNDLKITRKIRKSDQETSLINYIDSLKEKAKKFHELKEQYIFCPKCKMLLGTIWTQYPEQQNKIELICKREVDGGVCNTVVKVTTKQMLETKSSNKPEIMPESLQ
jgi:hypothetical protein